MKMGKVYLVGAGPGDPCLITLKALNIIKAADIILYDALVNPVCLVHKKSSAETILCGKRYGRESFPQEDTNKLMLKYANEGKTVVRLKGGDPWFFSRGAEEAEYLAEHGIQFEVVPGVSSPLAAAAYSGIPVSHRDWSSSISISTGHLKDGRTLDDIKIPNTETLIYLMAVTNLEEIVGKILSSGRPPETPAVLIQSATLGRQKTVLSTLENIVLDSKENNIEPPAILIVGKAVKIREKLKWYETLPLFGKRLVLTRPINHAWDSIAKLASLGADVIYYPTLALAETQEADRFFKQPEPFVKYSDIIFVSENAVNIFFSRMNSAGLDARSLAGINIHAIGPTTAKALMNRGIISETVPPVHTSEGLLETLSSNLKGRNFLIPRAREGSETLTDGLAGRGADVKRINIYSIVKPDTPPLNEKGIDGILFTSRMGAKNFMEMNVWPSGAIAFCIGKSTAAALECAGVKTVIAKSATISSLIESACEYWR